MYKYEFDGFEYYLVDDNGDTIDRMEEVGICFDSDGDVLLKHGQPERVYKYYHDTIVKFSDFPDLFKITFIQGKFPVDEVNKCLDISGYIGIFYKKLVKESVG